MSTLLGQTLSHYRITGRIGAGGMGEVYRATDTSLGREVAIKVLPSEVAGDPERLARFRREARLLASLNHPNIAAIYGIEESEAGPFLALELVEGEDLKQRLDRGPIPVEEALEIALRVAEALEEAHGKGIVHRDLKPANVKRTPAGKVKVLDFGLAKAWASEVGGEGSSASALSQSPTMARGGTMAGVVLGTAAYMSPEQARGKAVDKRADVWSFGVLLWEMLTGRALFTGETVTDVIAAVVSREPDLGAVPATTPATVRRLIARCLRKDPRQRLPDIGAARLELQDDAIAGGASDASTAAASVPGPEALPVDRRRLRRERLAWAALVLVTAALAGALVFRSAKTSDPDPSVHFAIDPPDGWSFAWGWPVPSPDGRHVIFVAIRTGGQGQPGSSMLWVRTLQSPTPRPLPGAEGPIDGVPFWSPDSRSVAFFAGGELRKLRLEDGTVQRICALPKKPAVSGDWSEAGLILFSAGGLEAQIYSVGATGGEARPLAKLDPGEAHHHAPQFLPDGRRFLFVVFGGRSDRDGTYLSSIDSPHEKRRIAPEWRRRLHGSGYLLTGGDGTLLAQRFDPRLGTIDGEGVAIASHVGSWSDNSGLAWFAVSPSGTLAFLSGSIGRRRSRLAWLDRNGKQTGSVGEPAAYEQIALSPDERSVAVEIPGNDGAIDLWVMDLARGVTTRVTATPDNEQDPVWSPDGRSLAFCVWPARSGERGELRRKGLRAGDPEVVMLDASAKACPESWSRDGRTILVHRQAPDISRLTAWALSDDGKSQPEPLLTKETVDEPQISPDGRWFAFTSVVSGSWEVYIEPFHRDGDRVRVSVNRSGQPKWRADGRELFFATPNDELMTVDVRPQGERLEVSPPKRLFALRGQQNYGTDDFAPAADGQRFLVKIPVEEVAKPQLHIVTNWPSLLQR